MKEINVCSKPCPEPVIETKKVMERFPGEILKVTVDDEAAKVNVSRFAKGKKYKVEQKELPEGKTSLLLSPAAKKEKKSSPLKDESPGGNTVIFLKTYKLGQPDKELGELLMKTLFQTIPDLEVLPSKIVFMHGSVKHTVENSETLEQLKKLSELGVDIAVCGTCLDYYGIKDKLKVGRISNFFEIASILTSASNTVSL